jgi:hypothetical protein
MTSLASVLAFVLFVSFGVACLVWPKYGGLSRAMGLFCIAGGNIVVPWMPWKIVSFGMSVIATVWMIIEFSRRVVRHNKEKHHDMTGSRV